MVSMVTAGSRPHHSLNEEDIQFKKWEAQGIQLGDSEHSVSCESSPTASPTKERKKVSTADRKNMNEL